MKLQYVPYDPNHYATDLKKKPNNNSLDWTAAPGQSVIIVQTPYGMRPTDRRAELTGGNRSMIEAICDALSERDALPEEYAEVFPFVWCRYVTAAARARGNGCPIRGEASTYWVIACENDGETVSVHDPQAQAMSSPFYDIPMELRIGIEREKVMVRGLFRHRQQEQETGFYMIHFPDNALSGYQDGTMSIVADSVVIPVTKAVLEHKTVYIRTESWPELTTVNPGLKITQVISGR